MHAAVRGLVFGTVTLSLALATAGCGSADQAGDDAGKKDKKGPLTIGLLLPENQTARYERFDRPLMEKKIKELAGKDTKILYSNAKQDATLQQQQVDTMIAKKVDALILDAVDAKSIASSVKKADGAGIPVVAYDRLAEGPIKAYTSVDNPTVGKIQASSLLKELGDKADDGKIVMMNGSITDPNAKMYKDGAHSVLDGKVKIGKEYDTKEWKPENANENMKGALSALGKKNVVGVYSANDGMAGGVITALKGAGFTKDNMPPVTGQDAELNGVQRILTGEQFMSVYKPYVPETEAAAKFAVALAKGDELDDIATSKTDSESEKDVPTIIVKPLPLTKDGVKKYVGQPGFFTAKEICTAKFESACAKADIK
ncbi:MULTISPECIES: substrate-binding domain-containing protein [Streptomyces]|uniref:Solute-binding protein n=1 Tax=Streptomyces cacaoi TaxID=1898 RepID=A0A4Y3R7A7_STRCI|nr:MULTISPECIES: substrate-binding domain-containing protein [Streptomyces]NNG87418.1 sugar ABC transporter substrate-binding protein [Streptomyces cacaoi]GEB53502.1 solute-binding protein [Streptomyces cacaoi]